MSLENSVKAGFIGMYPLQRSICGLLCRLRSIAAHRDRFVRRLSVRLSGSHTFLVVTHSYVSQATHAFLGMLPLCYNKLAPFFGNFKNFPETKNNSRFYILKVFFPSHDDRFSCPVTSLLHISPQSCCILFKMRENQRFWQNRYLL